jgi:hypothetical protein
MPPLKTLRQARRDEKVRAWARGLLREMPALDQPRLRPLIYNYARITLLAERVYAALAKRPAVDRAGNVPQAADVFQRLTITQMRLASALGLTPAARSARMRGLDLPAEFARIMGAEDSDDE